MTEQLRKTTTLATGVRKTGAGKTGTPKTGAGQTAVPEMPTRRLGREVQNLATAVAERALSSITDKVDGMAGRLTDYVEHGESGLFGAVTGRGTGLLASMAQALTGDGGDGGSHPIRAALGAYAKEKIKGIFGGGKKGKGGKGKKLKVTNIVETLDIGAPLPVVYNQWTRFEDFPSFMKKVESVEQKSDEKLAWKAQIWWSHRTWESTIVEQVPDSHIIWRSKGAKGYVDGAVTFHELAPRLTRVLLVLEYHPQGLFEGMGNLWRAQGRRARLEFKHFRRHVMTQTLLHPEEVEGWRGEIRDSRVVKDQEAALREEEEHGFPGEPGPEAEAEYEAEVEPETETEAEEAAGEREAGQYASVPFERARRGREPMERPVRRRRPPMAETRTSKGRNA
ncbi:SRPBCC family protein [Sphaerimonospora mesophila]|uniref:SRPBCC family protein n=1 Tax=Sphaerimonospora mesophila TaxID=37483 RepID=UPI0006E1A480